jgi:flagellin-like hook-associated protein FlgL
MQLTNFSYLNARNDYNSSLVKHSPSVNRLSTGEKLHGPDKDLGAIGQEATLRNSRLAMNSKRVSMQNFVTFLDTQQQTLQQVRGIYDRMSTLSHQALDPTLSTSSNGVNGDKELLDKEFTVLAEELDSILDRKVNGQLLFGGTAADFTDGIQDTDNVDATPLRITKDVKTTSGKITVKLAPGGAEDQIWVFQGDLPASLNPYFDRSTAAAGSSQRQLMNAQLHTELESLFETHGIFTTGEWQTSGSSNSTDSNGNFKYDTFEVEFNTCDVNASFTPHPLNSGTGLGQDQYDTKVAAGLVKFNAPSGESTKITMIGVNMGNTFTYEVEANFEPSLPYNDVKIPSSGEVYPAISFGKIDCAHISSSEKAKKVLNILGTEIENLTNSMAQVAASQRRYESEIQYMGEIDIANEAAGGRITDADYASEATKLAKQSLKMGLASQIMSNTSRLKDVLIPLTTEHFRSKVLSSTL